MPTQDSQPRWVATGPLLPLAMFIATLIAALKYPDSPILWIPVILCAAAALTLVVRALVLTRRGK